jgi:hypothetical protein
MKQSNFECTAPVGQNSARWRRVSSARVALIGAFALSLGLAPACGDDDDSSGSGGKGGAATSGGSSATTGGSSATTGGRGGNSSTGGATTARGGSAQGGGNSGAGGVSSEGGAPGQGGASEAGAPGNGEGGSTLIDTHQYDGKQVFRFDTFGDEQFWTGTLRLNEAIQAALDPLTALKLGLKVDADVLPAGILDQVPLDDPATTVALIKMNAVVGVQGQVDAAGNLLSVGVTCALCHSNVDDSVMPGIGSRLDGHANRDLDPGAIIALSPGLAGNKAALDVLNSWGPGMYDARWNQDGINAPVQIPSIYGLKNVPLETYTGDGPISYWNAYVAVTQMGGQGTFFDPRIDVAVVYSNDKVTPKLPALYAYEVSLEPPAVPAGSFNAASAERGKALFTGAAKCSTCHSGPAYTDAAERLHAAAETDMDSTAAKRSATGLYRTSPLFALAQHPPYFHDASAKTLADVVTHYNSALSLGLTADQQKDLTEYLKSL